MFEKLKVLAARLDELEIRLSAPDLYDDPDRAAKLLRERNELEPIATAFREYEQAQRTLADADRNAVRPGHEGAGARRSCNRPRATLPVWRTN